MPNPPPDFSFRLTDAMRADVPSHIDADALERLLQRFPAASRASVLESIVLRPTPKDDGTPGDVSMSLESRIPICSDCLRNAGNRFGPVTRSKCWSSEVEARRVASSHWLADDAGRRTSRPRGTG